MDEDKFIVGIGEILWDTLYKNGRPVKDGRKLGGAPANCVFHATQFGHEGIVVSAIGMDKDGEDIISELESHNVMYHLSRTSYHTGIVKADISNPNDPIYAINTKSAWSHIPYNESLQMIAPHTKAVCYGTLAQWRRESRRTIRMFLDSCPEDCLKVFDINLRHTFFNKPIIQEGLRRANILKLNEDELEIVTKLLGYQLAGEEVLCRRLMRAYHLDILILTKGIHGSWILWKDGKSYQVTPEVKVKSTVGAGDAFTGAFIGCYLNGKSIAESHKTAVKVSAYVCTQDGAMPDIPNDLLL